MSFSVALLVVLTYFGSIAILTIYSAYFKRLCCLLKQGCKFQGHWNGIKILNLCLEHTNNRQWNKRSAYAYTKCSCLDYVTAYQREKCAFLNHPSC